MTNENLFDPHNNQNDLVKDLLETESNLDLASKSKQNSNPITTNNKVNSANFNPEQENVSDFDLLNRKNGWLGRDSAIDNQNNNVALGCSCPTCCGTTEYLSLESESIATFSNSAASSSSVPSSIIDGLLTGYQWNTKTITYSFYENDVFNGSYYGSEGGVKEVSDKVKDSVREILELVETFVDLDFVEVAETNTSTYGQVRYMLSDNPGYAYAYLPYNSDPRSGDVHLKSSYDHSSNLNGFQNEPGKHGYTTLIHETFHALGLDHPHNGTILDPKKDNYSTTVMTYDFKGNAPGTAMAYDIAALQQMYGATANNVGNDTYVFGSTTDIYTIGGVAPVISSHRIKQTIWDSDGTDTLDFSGLSFQSSGYSFDLNEGGWLVANAQNKTTSSGEKYYNYGTSLAYDMTIENVIGSSSNDKIIANAAANTFSGYQSGIKSGNDTLVSTDRLDTLDLSSYSVSDVTQTQTGNNLVIDLGSDGSVTVKDYYAVSQTNRLNIQFEPETPTPVTPPEPETNSNAIAEVGKITNIDHNEQTISLQNDYVNPVVFAQPLSYNGSDPATVRITNINAANDTVSFYVQEAEYKDGVHTTESFSYMVVEAGTWQLEDGTLIEVGTLDTAQETSNGWQSVSFENDFNSKPVILSQVQTNNDPEFVRTRQKGASAGGFKVKMEEEEALTNSGHQEETLGWLAIDSGSGEWDGMNYQAENTGRVVNHNWSKLDLSDFENTPNLLGSIATHYGSDSSGLRYREISGASGSTIEVKIEEEQSKDREVIHAKEEVNIFAIEGSGILTAQPYDSLTSDSFVASDTIEDVFAVEVDTF